MLHLAGRFPCPARFRHPGPAQSTGSRPARPGSPLTLLRGLSEASPGTNVAASPSSLAAALAMLQLGARGATASQISAALGTRGITSARQAAALRWLTASEDVAARQASIQLESANGLWTRPACDFAAVQLPYRGQRFAALVMMPTGCRSEPAWLITSTRLAGV